MVSGALLEKAAVRRSAARSGLRSRDGPPGCASFTHARSTLAFRLDPALVFHACVTVAGRCPGPAVVVHEVLENDGLLARPGVVLHEVSANVRAGPGPKGNGGSSTPEPPPLFRRLRPRPPQPPTRRNVGCHGVPGHLITAPTVTTSH